MGSFKCLRCQLPRENPFFPAESEDGVGIDALADSSSCGSSSSSSGHPYRSKFHHRLCQACGAAAPLKCSGCNKAYYCTKEHQRWHWRAAHKNDCTASPDAPNTTPSKEQSETSTERAAATSAAEQEALLFPQYELAVEEEVLDSSQALPPTNPELLAATPVAATAVAGDAEGVLEDKEVTKQFEEGAAAGMRGKEDSVYKRFMQRVRMGGADQVLRYCRWTLDTPVLVHAAAYGSAEVPEVCACTCGAPRRLEFQVMPQLLHFLNVGGGVVGDHLTHGRAGKTAIDWGALDVWTCTASCSMDGVAYTEEVITRQEPVPYVSKVVDGKATPSHHLG